MMLLKSKLVFDFRYYGRFFYVLVVIFIGYNTSVAQCLYSPVIAKKYFVGDCGDQYSQNLLGVQIPVYGNSGGLYFTSPLTNNMNTTGTKDIKFVELSMYPNPTFDYIHIKWGQPEDADLFIYTQIGQLISRSNLEANTISTIDVQHLLPGYYIIKAVTSSNQIFISKLIKQ